MTFLLSAKGNNIMEWRAAGDFAITYRQAMLARASSGILENASELFDSSLTDLEHLGQQHEKLLAQLSDLLMIIAATPPSAGLKELTADYYGKLYHHMELFHSAPIFYRMSMAFLQQLCTSLVKHTLEQLGLFASRMPQFSLTALGPAGRFEYTPFCPLQLIMVHGDTDSSGRETLGLFSSLLHSAFEELGLRIDSDVTPRNPDWRKSLTDWRRHCSSVLEEQDHGEIIGILRLAEQFVLPPEEELGQQLAGITTPLLRKNRQALENLVSRMQALSNGLSLMGNLRLERRRPENGLFSLLDHGLLPLSSAISVLSLIKGTSAKATPQRVKELLGRNEIDVDLSESILAVWHTLHEFLLLREKEFRIDPHNRQPLYLDPEQFDERQLSSLKSALESVALIQRQVGTIFSWMGE